MSQICDKIVLEFWFQRHSKQLKDHGARRTTLLSSTSGLIKKKRTDRKGRQPQ